MKTKKRRVWDTNSFAEELYKRSEGRYILKGEYIKYNDRIDTLCKACGNVFKLSPDRFISRNNGCPYCTGNAGRDSKWLADKTFEVVGDEFTFLDEYKGSSKKHRIRHNPCGVTFEVSPSAFFNRPTHAKCPEEFRERVRSLAGDEYVFQADYKGNNVPLPVLHIECGRTFDIRPKEFIVGQRCVCKSHLKSIYENYKDSLGEDYELVDGINSVNKSSDEVTLVHSSCGTEFPVRASNLSQGYKPNRCPECRPNKRKSTAQFKAEVYDLVGNSFDVLSGYSNRESRIGFRHNDCGNVFVREARRFLENPICAPCNAKIESEKRRLDRLSEIVEKFSASFKIEYLTDGEVPRVLATHRECGVSIERSLSGLDGICAHCSAEERYKNNVMSRLGSDYSFIRFTHRPELSLPYQRGVELKHLECGHVYETSYSKIMEGSKCPNCVYSRGEKAVADVLDSLSIEYTREHSFEYLGRKRFDFFIPSLNIAIEYDGEQHYKSIDAWGGEEYLEYVRQSDALKNDFCDYMGIDLLRIPYWEFDNIDEIVTNFIDNVKLMRSISANSMEMAKCR